MSPASRVLLLLLVRWDETVCVELVCILLVIHDLMWSNGRIILTGETEGLVEKNE